MSTPLVSIIIVNWNGIKVLPDCLNSLSKLLYSNWELIIVDNGSSDESQNLYKKYKLKAKRISLVLNHKNEGFARANNQGYEKARGKYILLLNNDTKVTPDFLTKMVEKMEENPKIGAMQPKIYLMDSTKRLDNAGSFLNSIGFTQHWGYGASDQEEFDRERKIFSAKGACLLTRRSIIQKAGLFDSDFHSYFEESDFCWRVWLIGYEVLYYPKVHIYHKVGFTSKRMSQIEINYFALRNRLLSFYKNVNFLHLFTLLFVHICFLVGLGIYYFIKLQFGKSWMVFSAIFWNIIHLPESFEKRAKVQALRTQPDSEFFPIIMEKTNFMNLFNHFKKVEENFK